MYFIILCFDQPHVGELREKTRPAHLEYLKQHAGLMHLGGPMENDDGGIVGTIFIINVADRAAALAFTREEPFHKAGVFESVIVRRWRQMQPERFRVRMPVLRRKDRFSSKRKDNNSYSFVVPASC